MACRCLYTSKVNSVLPKFRGKGVPLKNRAIEIPDGTIVILVMSSTSWIGSNSTREGQEILLVTDCVVSFVWCESVVRHKTTSLFSQVPYKKYKESFWCREYTAFDLPLCVRSRVSSSGMCNHHFCEEENYTIRLIKVMDSWFNRICWR
jgi:hypothetical protein